MVDNHTFGFEQARTRGRLGAWYHRDRPAIVAAAWMWIFFLILALVSLFTGWASLVFTMLLEVLVSFFTGMLAARKERRANPDRPNYKRMGSLAGFYLCLTTAFVLTIVALLVGIGSMGLVVPLMIPYFLSLPVQLGFCSFSSFLGALVYKGLFARS